MQTEASFRLSLSFIVVLLTAAMSGYCAGRDCQPEYIRYASDHLVAASDSISARLSGRVDSAEMVEARRLEVKDCLTLTLDDHTLTAVIVGNHVDGELLLVDSSGPAPVVRRLPLNIPSRYASLGELKDVNLDGNPELFIYEASGSHGMYLVLVSICRDSLSFVRDEEGRYQFFASGGSIQVADLNGDGTCEIVLTEMVWGDDPKADADSPSRTVYRWRDGMYISSKEADSRQTE